MSSAVLLSVVRPGIHLIHSFSPVNHLFKYSCSFHCVIQFMLLLKITDHMFRPCQISYRFPSYFFQEESHTTRWGTQDHSSSSVCLSLYGRKILSDYFLISREVPAGASGLRLLPHRFPTLIRGRLEPFPCLTPFHTPFPALAQHPTQHHLRTVISLDRLERKNKLTNIPPEKKRHAGGGPPVVWHMGFIRERGLTLSVWGARSVSNHYFICIHLSSYNSYQLSITDTRLSIVGW